MRIPIFLRLPINGRLYLPQRLKTLFQRSRVGSRRKKKLGEGTKAERLRRTTADADRSLSLILRKTHATITLAMSTTKTTTTSDERYNQINTYNTNSIPTWEG